jgi:hypothetical protein
MENTSPKYETWIRIVEAQFEDLIQLKASLLATAEDEDASKQLQYIDILLAYFRQDVAELEKSQQGLGDTDLLGIAQVRHWIRAQDYSNADFVVQIESKAMQIENRILRGEFYFVLGTASHCLKNYRKASDYYLAASGIFESAGAKKKAMRSLSSYVASHSCEHPQARLFSEHMTIYKSALQLSEFQTAATSLVNISREFQSLDALAVALDYAVQAEVLFMQHGPGSREHGLCLLQKAHILLQMDRVVEAKKAFQYSMVSKHAEVLSAAKVLAVKLNINFGSGASDEQLLPTWSERLLGERTQRVLGELEGKLISLLAEGPKDKLSLMDSLYGDKILPEARENRFKNLMSRVRAKLPGLIVLKNSNYEIVDSYALGDFQNRGVK